MAQPGGVDGGVCPEMLVSPEDKRSYRLISLENGLTALLVHDPEIAAVLAEQQAAEGGGEADGAGRRRPAKRRRDGGGGGLLGCCSAPKREKGEEPEAEDEGPGEGEEDDDMDSSEGEGGSEGEDGSEGEEGSEGEGEEGEEGPKTKSAAAALTVNIGSFADPPHAQGLAHFLEHMLFMGSERFPDENEAEEFLSTHGGYSNAYTDVEHTTYYFELEPGPGVLEQAVDRWSAFFTCPLLKEDCLSREIDAVNSEFQGVEQDDYCRTQQLLSHDGACGHPVCNFTWGNAKSLGSATREDLLSFWRQHYNAAVSKLVLLGGESLDELEGLARNYFAEMRPKPAATDKTTFAVGGAPGPLDITGLPPAERKRLPVRNFD